ncbi:unnamed protein product [marine sediment metagenome]|uniref:Cytosolic protein n=1 Tax=marine sediment metagenome TaxID=412755 RepID=X0Y8Q8_9ZZZZ
MKCKIDENLKKCPCSYSGCSKKGKCCDCLEFHIKNKELPACVFPKDIEKTYNRSFEKFAELVKEGKI